MKYACTSNVQPQSKERGQTISVTFDWFKPPAIKRKKENARCKTYLVLINKLIYPSTSQGRDMELILGKEDILLGEAITLS